MEENLIMRILGEGTGGWIDMSYHSPSHNITETYWVSSMGCGWIPDVTQQMYETLARMDPFQHRPPTDWANTPAFPESATPVSNTYEDLGPL